MRYFKKQPLPGPLLSLPVTRYPARGTGGEGQALYGDPEKLFCRLCEYKGGRKSEGRAMAGSAYFSGEAKISVGDMLSLPDGRRFEVFSVHMYRLRDGAPHHLRAALAFCRQPGRS